MPYRIKRITQRRSIRGTRHALALAAHGIALLTILLTGPAEAQLRPASTGNFASADSAATAYSNPAGMSRLDRRELVLDTLLVYSRSKFKIDDVTTTAGGDADLNNNFIAIPSAYFVTPALHERVRFGFSLNVPSGIGSDYGDSWSGRYIATESSLVYIAMNASTSVRVVDWLSLGAGLQVLYTSSTSKSKINNGPEFIPDGRVEYEASGIGFGGVVSALIEVDELVDFERLLGRDMPLRFGIMYRPKTETDIDGVPELKGVGPLLAAALAANGLINKKIELKTTSPQQLGVGLYMEPIDRLSVTLDLMWIDMEQFGNVEVSVSDISVSTESNYRDTYLAGVSLGWELTEEIDLLAGFSYLSSPISDGNRSLSLPIDRIYMVGAGIKYRPRDWFELFTAFNYYDTGESRVDTEPSSRAGRLAGESSPHFAVGVDIGLTFRF